VRRCAVGSAEDAGVEIAAVELCVLAGAVLAPAAKHVHGGGVEVDAATRGPRLAAGLVELVADRHERSGHR
jgi:hypothetical protein